MLVTYLTLVILTAGHEYQEYTRGTMCWRHIHMSSNKNIRGKWGQPHILFYISGFHGLSPKCQLISSIILPVVLPGCWDIMSLHFQIGSAKQISFRQEIPPVQGPELPKQATELISRGWGLPLPRLLSWSRDREGEALTMAPYGVWAGLVTQQGLTPDLTTNLPGLVFSQPPLDDDLSSRRLSGLFLSQVSQITSSVLSGLFVFWRSERLNRKKKRKKSDCS